MIDFVILEFGVLFCFVVCWVNGRFGVCEGCFWMFKEIVGWSGMSLDEKEVVLVVFFEWEK